MESCFRLLLHQSAHPRQTGRSDNRSFFNSLVLYSLRSLERFLPAVSVHLLHIRLGCRSAEYAVGEQCA